MRTGASGLCMLPRPAAIFAVAVLLGFARAALAGDAADAGATAPGDFLPYQGAQPLVVWIQTDPWLMVINSDTPRVVLYEDGELVFLKAEKPSYRHRRLHGAELDSVRKRLAAVAALDQLQPEYDLAPNATDQPEALLYVHSGQREVVTRVYGLVANGTRLPAWTSIPTDRKPNSPPVEVLELHRFLASLTESQGSEWRPRYLEVMIWPYEYASEESVKWPAKWPGLNADRTVDRGGDRYSIYLDATLETELVHFLSKRGEKAAIEIAGRKWAASVRPVFPMEPVWRKAFDSVASH